MSHRESLLQSRARLRRSIGSVCLTLLLLASGGCGYIETQLARQGTPDPRPQLGWQDRLSLYRNEIDDYTCAPRYFLQCERSGSITYSCQCVPR